MLLFLIAVLLVLEGVTLGADSLTDGLRVYLPFNGSAADESGLGNHGTVLGAALTEDRFGRPDSAYDFDGIDDLIRIEASASLVDLTEITLAAWVKIRGNSHDLGIIVSRWNQSHTVGDYYMIAYDPYYVPNTIMGASYQHAGWRTALRGDAELGVWTFVVFSISPVTGEERLYRDGQLADIKSRSIPLRQCDLPVTIGADIITYQTANYFRFLDGTIDDVRIYDRVLSENEIQMLYLEEPCNYGPGNQPLTVTRLKGKPVYETFDWDSCGGPGTMIVETESVTSAHIYLNGSLLLEPADFKRKSTIMERSIQLHEGPNTLTIELCGKPGSQLKVSFQRHGT